MEKQEKTNRQKLIDRLEGYNYLCSRILDKQETIMEIRSRLESSSTSSVDAIPNFGGGNKYEDKLANAFDRLTTLEWELCEALADKRTVDIAMQNLDAMEKDIIDLFYINRPRYSSHLSKLQAKYHYEKTRIYEIKDEALDKLEQIMYK